ncbi:MAG: hypothetical protein UT01_C0066G0001, partial [Candidatus Daviesbacteria bacterium GW2011_GWA1_38_7]
MAIERMTTETAQNNQQNRVEIEVRPVPEAPIYQNPLFRRIANFQIEFFNRHRETEKWATPLAGSWEQIAAQAEAARDVETPEAKSLREDFSKLTHTAELIFRRLYQVTNDRALGNVRNRFREMILDITKEEPRRTNPADPDPVEDLIQRQFGANLQKMEDDILVQDDPNRLAPNLEENPNIQYYRFLYSQSELLKNMERRARLLERNTNTDDLEQIRVLQAAWTELEQRRRVGTFEQFIALNRSKAENYANRWLDAVQRNNEAFWQRVPEAERENLRSRLSQNPTVLDITKLDEAAFNSLPEDLRQEYRDYFDLARVLARTPREEERRRERPQRLPEEEEVPGLPPREGVLPERVEDLSEDDLERILRQYGKDPDQIIRERASNEDFVNQEKDGQERPLEERRRSALEGEVRALLNEQVGQRFAMSLEEIPRRRRRESLEDYERRRSIALEARRRALGREFQNYLTLVRGKTMEWVSGRLNEFIWRVADANTDWDAFNYNPIQEIMQAVKYVDLEPEIEVKALAERDVERGGISITERDARLEQIAREKDNLVNLALGRINYHNVKRAATTAGLEQFMGAINTVTEQQHRAMMALPGVSRAVNDISEFNGAWYRNEERYTPTYRSTKETTDEQALLGRADHQNRVWFVRKANAMMREELVSYETEVEYGAPTRREIIDLFGDNNFNTLMTKAFVHDYDNKNKADRWGEAHHIEEREFYTEHVKKAFAEMVSDVEVTLTPEQRSLLTDSEKKDLAIAQLATMMFEATQAYDLADKAAYTTWDAFRYDGSKWTPEAYKRELDKLNTKRRAKNLREVGYMPNLAEPDSVILNGKDPDTGQAVDVNLAAHEACGLYFQKRDVYVKQVAMERAIQTRRELEEVRKEVDRELTDEKCAFLVDGDEPLEYWEDGYWENGEYKNGRFNRKKYTRDSGVIEFQKRTMESWDLPEMWTSAKREFIAAHKREILINDDKETARQVRTNYTDQDQYHQPWTKPNVGTLFEYSLRGKSQTLGRRLLNLSTYNRRLNNKNRIEILDAASIIEVGGDTLRHVTGRSSIQEQLGQTYLGDIAIMRGTWVARQNAAEAVRTDFTDNPPLILLSNNSIRNNAYDGLTKLAEKIAKIQDYGELGGWWVHALKEVADYNLYEIRNKTKGEYKFMNIIEADNLFLRAFYDANIGKNDYRKLQSEVMGHWLFMEAAVFIQKTNVPPALWGFIMDIFKA